MDLEGAKDCIGGVPRASRGCPKLFPQAFQDVNKCISDVFGASSADIDQRKSSFNSIGEAVSIGKPMRTAFGHVLGRIATLPWERFSEGCFNVRSSTKAIDVVTVSFKHQCVFAVRLNVGVVEDRKLELRSDKFFCC